MALKASHSTGQLPPKPIFIGRHHELRIIEQALWAHQAPDEHRVVSIHGVAGQGKSSLVAQVRSTLREAKPFTIPSALLDLDLSANRDPVHGLLQLRTQLRSGGMRTPAFDVAFARNFALTHGRRNIKEDYPELFRGGDDLLGDLAEIAGSAFSELPGGKLVFSALSKLSDGYADWYRRKGNQILSTLDDLTGQELRDNLPLYLGYDTCSFVNEEPRRRPVVLLDTFEALWRGTGLFFGPGDSMPDAWVRKLVEESPGALFIIAGRRKLLWNKVNSDWEGVVIDCGLAELSAEEAEEFLQAKAVVEPEIRAKILENSRGHALSLNLQVRTYDKIKATGAIPKVEDFPPTRKEILDRFVSHLEPSLAALLQVASVPEDVDERLWHFLAKTFSIFDRVSFGEVMSDVFFRPAGEGRFVMHELVRDYLRDHLLRSNPGLLKQVRLAVFDYFDRASSRDLAHKKELGFTEEVTTLSEQDRYLMSAAEQVLAADPERYIDWSVNRLLDYHANGGGTKLRSGLIASAKKQLDRLPGKRIDPAMKLALLEVAGNPFATSGHELTRLVLEHTAAQGLSPGVGEYLLRIGSHLTHAGETELCQRIAAVADTTMSSDPGALASALRTYNFVKQWEKSADAVGRLLATSDGARHLNLWDALMAALAADTPDLLRALISAEASSDDSNRWLSLLRAVDTLLLLDATQRLPEILALFGFADLHALRSAIRSATKHRAITNRLTKVVADCLFARDQGHEAIHFLEQTGNTEDATKHRACTGIVEVDGRRLQFSDAIRARVELVIDRNSKAFILSDDPNLFWRSCDYIALAEDRVYLYDRRFGLYHFTKPIHPSMISNVGETFRVLFVYMDVDGETATPVCGHYTDVYSWYGAKVIESVTAPPS